MNRYTNCRLICRGTTSCLHIYSGFLTTVESIRLASKIYHCTKKNRTFRNPYIRERGGVLSVKCMSDFSELPRNQHRSKKAPISYMCRKMLQQCLPNLQRCDLCSFRTRDPSPKVTFHQVILRMFLSSGHRA